MLRGAPRTDCPRCPPHSTSVMGAVGTIGLLLVVGAEKRRAIDLVLRGARLVSVATARAAAGAAGSLCRVWCHLGRRGPRRPRPCSPPAARRQAASTVGSI